DPKKNQGRKRPGKNTFTTKSGNSITLNRSLTERIKAHRDAKARRRAAYLSTLPKNRFKRILYRLKPRELARYWFSRDGAIMALKVLGVAIVIFFVLIVGVFAYFRKDLPNINDLSGSKIGGSITYYDRTGTKILWQDYDAVKRVPVPGNQIPDYLRQATIAIEDKDFYKHGAFDVRGIARAGINDVLKKGGGVQGGSTISQQLVKLNENWTADRTITRKIKELILATELEREYSKADILNGYLNIAPYGPVEYGAQTAAQDYFGIDSKELSLAQSAMLAAIPKSPNDYSPYGPAFDAESLLGRQHYILDQMVAQKMITKQAAAEAKNVDVLSQVKGQPSSLYAGIQAPYFVLAAKQELQSTYGTTAVNRGGWKVLTTVDMDLQDLAEKAVANDVPAIKRQGGDNAAFVAEDNKTGQIVALVGGVDFNNDVYGKINFATDVNVSPGSSFKPYDYATFIENNTNAGAGSVMYDTRGAIPGYDGSCTYTPMDIKNGKTCAPGTAPFLYDYDNKFPGPVTLRYALGGSRNVPAVKAMLSSVPNDSSPGRTSSINKVISTAEAMMGNPDGYNCYTSSTDLSPGADPAQLKAGKTQCYGSSAIGDGAYLHLDDHVNGIATLARLGVSIPHTFILKITDSSNKTLYEFKQPSGKQVLRPDTAYIVNDMASDYKASYLPGSCTDTTCRQFSQGASNFKFQRYNGWKFAVKTGTTNSGYDGLMASWSTQYTALTWVGYHDRNKTMVGPGMEYMTEPIVRTWMQGAHDKLSGSAVNWQQPSGIKSLPAYVVRSHVGLGSIEPSTSNDLFPSWYVQPKSSNSSATIDIVSNKIATSCTPDLAKKTEGGANVNAFSSDAFFGGGSSSSGNTNAQDDVHNCNDSKPTITLTQNACGNGQCNFTVAVSKGTKGLAGGSYTTSPAGTVSLKIGDNTVQSVNMSDGDNYNYTFTNISVNDGQSVQATVVDSVLYSASDTLTANNTSSGGGGGTPILH
ncbi:MAG TPA: transglycosylase domain-containing protein, partial [Candidatus Saccharimonadales bacterium]|nr:transglycosylase domain-containing protein [Candidatus Saccharimonadales bacterium]